MPRSTRITQVLALLVWGLAIAGGFRVLVDYELKAGSAAAAPNKWPAEAALQRDNQRFNLVMFAHPQCPCSRASVAELAVIMTRCSAQLKATVCFFAPDGESAEWTQSSLWRAAAAIPGVTVVADRDGKIAGCFGSATSGQVHLFDREGRRAFSGGITGARGHQGENAGRKIVVALARGEFCSATTTPTFGCSLLDPEMANAEAHP